MHLWNNHHELIKLIDDHEMFILENSYSYFVYGVEECLYQAIFVCSVHKSIVSSMIKDPNLIDDPVLAREVFEVCIYTMHQVHPWLEESQLFISTCSEATIPSLS